MHRPGSLALAESLIVATERSTRINMSAKENLGSPLPRDTGDRTIRKDLNVVSALEAHLDRAQGLGSLFTSVQQPGDSALLIG
jgi:hypothetical protein